MSNEVKIKGFDGGEEGCIFAINLSTDAIE
jgi:hypothetical protein